MRWNERGLAAPFVFLGVAVLAAGSVEASPAIWTLSLGLLLLGAFGSPSDQAVTPGMLSLAAIGYALMLVLNNALVSPAYTAAAPFHAAFLAAGLLVGLRKDGEFLRVLFRLLGLGAGVLAVWSLWQISWGNASRATAHFETPTTLAAVLVFALLYVLVRLYLATPGRIWMALGVLLSAGVAATVSRGGLLALLAGLLVAAVFARRMGIAPSWRGATNIALVLAAGGMIAFAANAVPGMLRPDAPALHSILGAEARSSSVSRLELYALALDGMQARWVAGIGYLGFRSLLDANREAVPTFMDGDTYFVHNDYLQTLLELGIGGLIALLGAILLPQLLAWRAGKSGPDRELVVAMLAAVASFATLAAVDFPFYVPICLVLFGLAIGVLDRRIGSQAKMRWHPGPAFRRLGAITLAAGAAFVLGPPLIADLAASHAHRAWRASDGQAAAYWFEVARRFEPRDWRYHWYAGQFWYLQAAQTGKPAAARQADQAFAAGMSANPVEVQNHLGRLSTHRQFASLLEAPATPEVTRTWVGQAAAVAPHHPGVRAELARLGATVIR
ncbi:MAG: O-antigen ligase family protein [Betaproteobacteria bacterium]